MAELHCHGGMFVAARVLETVLSAGARAAEAGEFTLRAFLNGKMDLTQAEAVMDIIRARTPQALAAAEAQLHGRLGKALTHLREYLLDLVARVEADIDFPEEGIDPTNEAELRTRIERTLAQTAEWIASANEGRVLREGVRVALCGAPNVGKSSLLNRLLESDRAIVTPVAGTTRDTIEESLVLRGVLFRLTDTAGLRETTDAIEALGIERTCTAIADADIVLRIFEGGELSGESGESRESSTSRQSKPSIPPSFPTLPILPAQQRGEAAQATLLILNKSDLLLSDTALPEGTIPISCLTGEGIPELVTALVAKAGIAIRPSGLAISARHLACLRRAHDGLLAAFAEIHHSPEYVAQGLHDALDAVGEILGLADSEEILGEIFAKFCIGK